MPDQEGEQTIAQLLFQKNQVESIDFEIAFTAFLATMSLVVTSPTTQHRVLLQVGAGALLFLTLVRRIAVVNRFARERYLLTSTNEPVEFLSTVLSFQLFYFGILHHLRVLTASTPSRLAIHLLILVGVSVIILGASLLFRDYFLYFGAYFYGIANTFQPDDTEEIDDVEDAGLNLLVSRLAQLVAFFTLRDTIPPHEGEALDELREFVRKMEQQFEPNESTGKIRIAFVSGVFIMGSAGALSVGISQFKGSLAANFVLVLVVGLISHYVRFLYLANGALHGRISRSVKRQIAGPLVYAVSIIWLFF